MDEQIRVRVGGLI